MVSTDRRFTKDTHARCFNNYTTTIFFIFFLAGTIDSLNRTRGKQNLHDWYVCFHVVVIINIEKSCRDLSHTRVENCMHVQVWTLFHVANQQSGHNQVVGNHHNHHKKLRPASTVLSSNHSLLTFSSRI